MQGVGVPHGVRWRAHVKSGGSRSSIVWAVKPLLVGMSEINRVWE